MKNPLNNLHKEAHTIKLSAHEKRVMHARIMAHVAASRARAGGSAHARPVVSPYMLFAPQFVMPFAALLLIVLGGSGVFAAQNSLPGDALYSIKTKVSEPVRGALALSTEDKIQFHAEVVQTRIEEAELLASQNKLDTSATLEIESNIDDHLAQGDELKQKLGDTHGRSGGALATIDSAIDAHSDVLLQLGAQSANTPTRENSGTIAMRVRSGRGNGGEVQATFAMAKMATPSAPQPVAMMMAVSVEDTAASDTSLKKQESNNASLRVTASTSDQKQSKWSRKEQNNTSPESQKALALAARATTSLEQMKKTVGAIRNLDQDTKDRLERRFASLDESITEGTDALARGEYQDARDIFGDILNREVQLTTFISAQQKFDNGILGHLLGGESGRDNKEE